MTMLLEARVDAASARLIRWHFRPAPVHTPILAAHINELRRTVDRLRRREGLPSIAWTDDPIVRLVTPILAIHFVELREVLQDLWDAGGMGPLPVWTVGAPPSPGRMIRADDLNDLREWTGQFERRERHAAQGLSGLDAGRRTSRPRDGRSAHRSQSADMYAVRS